MPRAKRHFLPGYVRHITHRCHRKSFLLKFARDRRAYLRWVVEARKGFGISVLDYFDPVCLSGASKGSAVFFGWLLGCPEGG